MLIPVTCLAAIRLPLAMIYADTGYGPGSGKAASAWILVGIQDLAASEGWVNADNFAVDDYFAVHGREATDRYCRQQIAERMAEFRADPAMALRFFARKTTSQWNMPSFQAIAVNHNRVLRPGAVPWAQALLAIGGRLHGLLLAGCDLLLTQLWAWTLLWLLLGRRRGCPEDILFAVVFVGGFLLHLLWEAKARNTLIYAFLLFPCAVQGWCAFGAACATARGDDAGGRRLLHRLWPTLAAAAVLAVSGVSGIYISSDRAEAQTRLAEYRQWQAEQAPDLPRGACLIWQAQSGQALAAGPGGVEAHLCAAADRQSVFTLLPLHDRLLLDSVPQTSACQILFAPENTLGVGMGSYEGTAFAVPKPGPDPFLWVQQWHLHPQGDDLWTISILDTGGCYLALTDTGSGVLTLQPERGTPDQLWRIDPVAPAA